LKICLFLQAADTENTETAFYYRRVFLYYYFKQS